MYGSLRTGLVVLSERRFLLRARRGVLCLWSTCCTLGATRKRTFTRLENGNSSCLVGTRLLQTPSTKARNRRRHPVVEPVSLVLGEAVEEAVVGMEAAAGTVVVWATRVTSIQVAEAVALQTPVARWAYEVAISPSGSSLFDAWKNVSCCLWWCLLSARSDATKWSIP